MVAEGIWSEKMVQETLSEILRTLRDYGQILKHIESRFDTMEKMIELVRSNQYSITERENILEHQCQEHHRRIDEAVISLSNRVSSLERLFSPIPQSIDVYGDDQ